MKKFSVGLPIAEKAGFVEKIIEYKENISEVYFSWGSFKSGRSAQNADYKSKPFEAQEKLLRNLTLLHENGLMFNLLFNANCYGAESLSKSLFYEIGDTIDYVSEKFNVRSVTTTSPLIAKFIKTNFPNVKTRASVNMEIGTENGMEYIAEYFDGFYLKREFNKYLPTIKRLRAWCD